MKVENLNSDNIAHLGEIPIIELYIQKHGKYPNIKRFEPFSDEFLLQFIKEINVIEKIVYQNGNKIQVLLGIEYELMVFIYLVEPNIDYEYDDYQSKSNITILYRETSEKFKELDDLFKKERIKRKEDSNNLYLLTSDNGYLEVEPYQIKSPEINFELNYNSDFAKIHQTIVNRLSTPQDKGIVLLHGLAGTGKTSYLRWLISNIKKKFIYIPPDMANAISDPSFIKTLLNCPNSILLIEDGENILSKRSGNSNQAISNLLNMSDGLLSDCANIQIIATFNTNIVNIDEALLRKGRLIARYEFKALELDVAKQLGKSLNIEITESCTLADIYNKTDDEFNINQNPIGFKK